MFQWGFYFERTPQLASLSELIWDSNIPLQGVNMDIFRDVIKGYITLTWNINTWNLYMKTILLQLHPSSNEFVFSFFVKLESEDHDIPYMF
jgi:hypothetical protein